MARRLSTSLLTPALACLRVASSTICPLASLSATSTLLVVPGGLDEQLSQVLVAGLSYPAVELRLAAGVLGGHEPHPHAAKPEAAANLAKPSTSQAIETAVTASTPRGI